MKPLCERTFDALCMGEALVDFLPDTRARRVRDVVSWTRCPGGSPANVAIGLARLGARSAYVGVAGEDEFGHFLKDELAKEGVDVAAMRLTGQARTGLVFITLDDMGERSFTDYRKPSAELLLEPADVRAIDLSEVRVVHLVANSLLLPAAAQAARELLQSARQQGCLTSCDPNLRCSFWDDPVRLRALIDELLPQLDVVKLAHDEVEFVTGQADPHHGLQVLSQRGVRLPVVTLGARGAVALWGGRLLEAGAPRVEVVDQTGAGDGFDAGLWAALCEHLRRGASLAALQEEQVLEALRFGCRVGARVVTRLGAVAGLPRRAQLG